MRHARPSRRRRCCRALVPAPPPAATDGARSLVDGARARRCPRPRRVRASNIQPELLLDEPARLGGGVVRAAWR
jgi:hypothetical protein